MDQETLQQVLDDHRQWSDPFSDGGKRADLRGAVLRDAILRGAVVPAYGISDDGEIIGWKAVQRGIAKVCVPPEAKRVGSIVGRKCRAEYVETLDVIVDGKSVNEAPGQYTGDTIYRVGETTYPDQYDDDPRVECSNGIHFFLTRAEAECW